MIEPTVGRKVWYRPKLCFSAFPPKLSDDNKPVMAHDQPFDATVLHVNDDGTINVLVCNEIGAQMGLTDIVLAQDRPAEPGECEWMPYQVGQAKTQPAAVPVLEAGCTGGCKGHCHTSPGPVHDGTDAA